MTARVTKTRQDTPETHNMLDVVWLKKDARVKDHGPLSEVLTKSTGPRFVLLYLYEPSQLRHHSCHGSHVAFANEGLAALEASLASLRPEAQKHGQKHGETWLPNEKRRRDVRGKPYL